SGDLVGWKTDLKMRWVAVSLDGPTKAQFRELAALAAFDPVAQDWRDADVAGAAAEGLLDVNPLYLDVWTEALRPVKDSLIPPLAEVCRGRKQPDKRYLAASVLTSYAADQPWLLADLALDADERQYALFLPRLKEAAEPLRPRDQTAAFLALVVL